MKRLLEDRFNDTELMFALVSPVGTEYKIVVNVLTQRLETIGYQVELLQVSDEIISKFKTDESEGKTEPQTEYQRILSLMDLGNNIREKAKDNSILALGIAQMLCSHREADEKGNTKPKEKVAYIVNSLKHPDEIRKLREIYTGGIYVISIASSTERRIEYLTKEKRMTADEAKQLIERDQCEKIGHGQQTRDAFQLADFFVSWDGDLDKIKNSLWRILDLIFGNPYLTPTFDEFAMYLAFTSALRSADLSRQVGAVIGKDEEILASGANDCPKAGGGLYWARYCDKTKAIEDEENGRDYKRGSDNNKVEKNKIIEDVISKLPKHLPVDEIRKALESSRLKDLTEFGRVVHAEMEALLFCARNNLSTKDATLYCTTFPCHNCAKHIIAAGINRVVYIEPYPKSLALDSHQDAITSKDDDSNLVKFLPFVGVGPRKFFDLFSMNLSDGYGIDRKDRDGKIIDWQPEKKAARLQMYPFSYLEKEVIANLNFGKKLEEIKDGSKSVE